jgi:hypothetical protein
VAGGRIGQNFPGEKGSVRRCVVVM